MSWLKFEVGEGVGWRSVVSDLEMGAKAVAMGARAVAARSIRAGGSGYEVV